MMVREEKQKTIYTQFGDNKKRLWIIPDSDFRKESDKSGVMFSGNHYIDFEDNFNFIEVMDKNKVLCIGFDFQVEIYNIKDNSLCPTLIKRLRFLSNKIMIKLKLDEHLLLIYDFKTL